MKTPGDKLWQVFQDVWQVLNEPDLRDFGRALFFGTAFKNLGLGARRVIEALALRIGKTTNPSQVYLAVAFQSWGYGALKELGNAADQKKIFRQLSAGNQKRMTMASVMIDWPVQRSTPTKVEPLHPKPKPLTSDPFEPRNDGEKGSGALVVVGVIAALILVGVMV